MRPLVVGDPDRAHLELVLVLLAPVYPHLEAEDDVEHEGEGEARADDGVPDLGGSREEAGQAAADLGDDGEGRELACALRAVVLADLRKLGEEGEREGRDLEEGEGGGRDYSEANGGGEHYLGGEDGALYGTSCSECARWVVVYDKEGDDDILKGEEEVLAVGGEGKLVAVRIGEGDRI